MRNAIGMEGWVRFSGFACLALVLSSGCSSIGTKIAVETGACCPLDVSTYRSFSIDSSGVPKFLRLYFAEELAAVLRDKGLVESEPPQLNLVLRFERGALDGASRAVFRGVIRVHPGAQGTDAYQTIRNLLLSPKARADSLPNLEIEADDVRCSHGATVGQLDAEAKFYLMSRGLDRVQAERLVVLGFLGEVLARLPLGGVVEKVTRVIEEKLARHG